MPQPELAPPLLDPRRALRKRPVALPKVSLTFDAAFANSHSRQLIIDDGPLDEIPETPIERFISPHTQYTGNTTTPLLPSDSYDGQNAEAGPSSAPSSPSTPSTRMFRRDFTKPKQPSPLPSGLAETRKLLSHLLDKLENRQVAPDLLDRAAIAARSLHGSHKGKGKNTAAKLGLAMASAAHKASHGHHGAAYEHVDDAGIGSSNANGEDEDMERIKLNPGEFDTDATCELVEQLRSLLVLANRQNLDLLSTEHDHVGYDPRPKRKAGRLSAVSSSISPRNSMDSQDRSILGDPALTISGTSLLDRVILALRSLIQVDCLHRTVHFRPNRPPLALHALCLDIATYVFHHCGDEIQLEVVDMVISGLYTMGEEMEERICQWLQGTLSELLRRLAQKRRKRGEGGSPKQSQRSPRTLWQGMSIHSGY